MLCNPSLDPAWRRGRAGVKKAKRLTQMCVDYARQSHEKVVGLHTSEKMEDAQRVYESIGFTRFKEIDPFYGMRYWVYRLDLS